MLKSWGKFTPLLVVLVAFVALFFIACTEEDTATTPASCAYIVGDGQDGRDAKLHDVVWPGQEYDRDQDEENVSYIPCNSRNFIVSDGKTTDANGTVVGDQKQLIEARTSTGVPIEIGVTAYWTLNQSESTLRKFYNVCLKFRCASGTDISGDANNSTPGWNDMLGENFAPALARATRLAAANADDTILSDSEQYQVLGDAISASFADEVRATVGYQDDLFCGSGNSAWSNPDKPGDGTFVCTPVRVAVDKVDRGEIEEDESTEGVKTLNQTRLANAEALYGEDAGRILGILDIIKECKAEKVTCIINIGDAPPVAVPANPN